MVSSSTSVAQADLEQWADGVVSSSRQLSQHVAEHQVISLAAPPSSNANHSLEQGLLWLAARAPKQPTLKVSTAVTVSCPSHCFACPLQHLGMKGEQWELPSAQKLLWAAIKQPLKQGRSDRGSHPHDDVSRPPFFHGTRSDPSPSVGFFQARTMREAVREELRARTVALNGLASTPACWVAAFNEALAATEQLTAAAAASPAAAWRWPPPQCAQGEGTLPTDWHHPAVQASMQQVLRDLRLPLFPRVGPHEGMLFLPSRPGRLASCEHPILAASD